MSGDRDVKAETGDQLRESRGEKEGTGDGGNDDRDPATFYPNADAYPAGAGALPPTAELDEPAATDALHPEGEHRDGEDQIETPDDSRMQHP